MPLTESIAEAPDIAFLDKKTAPDPSGAALPRLLPCEDQPASLAQSRLVIFFSVAYLSAEVLIIGLRMLLSA